MVKHALMDWKYCSKKQPESSMAGWPTHSQKANNEHPEELLKKSASTMENGITPLGIKPTIFPSLQVMNGTTSGLLVLISICKPDSRLLSPKGNIFTTG